MIQELFLYDRDEGLFKKILEKSQIIQGRYHVSYNGGNDLNTANLETWIKDPQNGLTSVNQKYPICVCMTPRSRYVQYSGGRWEEFIFNLYFVTTTGRTWDNKIKGRDADTGKSRHHIWYDWQDMKQAAMNFLEALKRVVKNNKIDISGTPVSINRFIGLDLSGVVFNRLSKFNNDDLTGVSVSFAMLIEASMCETPDYINLEDIDLPPLIIHSANDD